MRKIKKLNFPSDKEFAMTLAPFAKLCFYLGIFSYHKKRLCARKFEATMKPNLWNPLFYIVYFFIASLALIVDIIATIINTFKETFNIFTTSRAELDFDERYVEEWEDIEYA